MTKKRKHLNKWIHLREGDRVVMKLKRDRYIAKGTRGIVTEIRESPTLFPIYVRFDDQLAGNEDHDKVWFCKRRELEFLHRDGNYMI